MALADAISRERIVFLKNRTKRGALSELVRATCRSAPELDLETTLQAIWSRERLVSSWVDPGLAIPHGRIPDLKRFIVSVGKSYAGVEYESADGEPVHLLLMILGPAEEIDQHLLLLAEAARTLRSPALRERIVAARTRNEVCRLLRQGEKQPRAICGKEDVSLSLALLGHALSLARQTRAKSILVHYDGLRAPGFLKALETDIDLILVTQGKVPIPAWVSRRYRTLVTPFSGFSRSSQRSLALLLVLSQGLVQPEDRVISVFGLPGADTLDTLAVIDVAREIPSHALSPSSPVLGDIRPEVMMRVIQLATDISREGREGRPVGTAFIVGDHDRVQTMTSQLVMNPFLGYPDEQKNILDPSLDETVKEFSTIDGAFVLRGDGVILSAGTYLRPDRSSPKLQPGLGTRHAAAAGMTHQTNAIGVVVSQSTGRVTLFKAGALMMELEKARG